MRTLGVEEELLLVDATTWAPVPVAPAMLSTFRSQLRQQDSGDLTVEAEMQQEMIEVISAPHRELAALLGQLREGRAQADAGARLVGARILAASTSPMPYRPHATVSPRYHTMMDTYGSTTRFSLACGLHTHVAIESREEGVAVLDRIRDWLPVLIALSADSPFDGGVDTGYASYRTMLWRAWPCSGPNDVFGSVAAYDEHERRVLATGTLLDSGMLYFDARLSRAHPTVEIRVADMCLLVEDAAVLAGLCRGLVEQASRDWREGRPASITPTPLIRLAAWRAALSGVGGSLLHPSTATPCRADEAVAALYAYVRPSLSMSDAAFIAKGVTRILGRGSGADVQRLLVAELGSMAAMVESAVGLTVGSADYATAQ
ncbi:glutamate--cysteine ligase [Herbiconiux sp. L3-i23]|uniref:carboxylate-amine ligase n=1 Tax=Herbiconiux sp. L3-i23 TaxID=2905871 RepID=UPI002053B3A1|nr:glutamate--cysteine ligase [Herbiconiux sp. L3-i23]BDI22934.1 putative glutamate--cysteine ligase 2 [Herbiconiux sp. L3-i23]